MPSWLEQHGALTHFPIALLFTALAFEIGALIFRKRDWHAVSFWMLAIAVISAIPSLLTGLVMAKEMFGKAPATPPAVLNHRLAAFIASGIAATVLAWRVARKDDFGPNHRWAGVFAMVLACGSVGYAGYLGGGMVLAASPFAEKTPTATNTAPASAQDPKLVALGEKLYRSDANGCTGCHKLGGSGGNAGPDLTHEGSRQPDAAWQIDHLKSPTKYTKDSSMPPYNTMKPDDLKALAAFLVTRK